MTVPHLTPEQRAEALAAAKVARADRAEWQRKLAAGETSLRAVFEYADAHPEAAVAKLKIIYALRALPGYGPVRANAVLEEASIKPSRRVRGVGPQQRKALLGLIETTRD